MNNIPLAALLAACAVGLATPAAAGYPTLDGSKPIVIGHRGASGYLPEHTLQSYGLAIRQGADYIEPDVVMTKDGHLIVRHEPMLDGTTDVASKFDAKRKTTKMLDGGSTTAYFASDFTLAEIKTLRAIQPNAGRPQQFNGLYAIPTLAEVISLARSQSRTVGIYPELKHSTFHAELFGDNVFEDKLLAQLHGAYGNQASAPVFVQSFEVSNLQYLNGLTDLKLVQLIDANDVKADGSLDLTAPYDRPYDFTVAGDSRTFADLLTSTGLDFVNGYADGIGPWKPYLIRTVDDGIDRNGDGVLSINDRRVDGSTGVIEAAHAAGLLVHAYTFRNDASGFGFTDPKAEMAYYFRAGLDGLFTDFPDTGVEAVATVPEPHEYAMLFAGLGIVLVVTRRRRR